MSSATNQALVEEALRDCAAFDHGGQLAAAIKRVSFVAAFAENGGVSVAPATLALLITGDDKACETLAKAYTKALCGLGLIDGKAGNPASNSIDWTGEICDMGASRAMIEHSWASRKITEAGKASRSGTLVIRNIHEKPYEGCVDEAESSGPALKGGLEALTSFMTEETWGPRTPVVILTGPEAETRAFLAKTPDLANIFNHKSVHADALPPEPEVYATHLESPIKVKAPLVFKPRNA